MITIEDIDKLAELSQLFFDEDEKKHLMNQLTNIMQMVNALLEIDCTNVQPLTSVCCTMMQPMREDQITDVLTSEELFQNAPGQQADIAKELRYFIVPKVIE